MKAFILSLFIITGIGHEIVAYPIEPRPLRKLIIESEYIIVGYVKEIRGKKSSRDEDFDSGAIAIVEVKEVLQGNVSEAIIEISFSPNMICPAPARYTAGTTAVIFLKKHKGTYFTHALSYGAKELDYNGVNVYKSRILEMQEIIKKPEGLDKFMETVEWLVKCAENKNTRWEGTYELSPESDFMSYYAHSELTPFKSMLSQEQKARLKKVLFEESELHYVDLGLADLVYVGNEKDVHQLLLKTLKKLPEDYLYFADSYMERLILPSHDPQLEALLKKFDELQWEPRKDKEKKKIVDEFVAVLER